MTPKQKSNRRFELYNRLVDDVIATLPTPTHGLTLLVGWRHADAKGRFRMSTQQAADSVGVSKRRMIAILDDLIAVGALKVLRKPTGTRSTAYWITAATNQS